MLGGGFLYLDVLWVIQRQIATELRCTVHLWGAVVVAGALSQPRPPQQLPQQRESLREHVELSECLQLQSPADHSVRSVSADGVCHIVVEPQHWAGLREVRGQ